MAIPTTYQDNPPVTTSKAKIDQFINKFGTPFGLFFALSVFFVCTYYLYMDERKYHITIKPRSFIEKRRFLLNYRRSKRTLKGLQTSWLLLSLVLLYSVVLKEQHIKRSLEHVTAEHHRVELADKLRGLQAKEISLRSKLPKDEEILELERRFIELTPVFNNYLRDKHVNPEQLFNSY